MEGINMSAIWTMMLAVASAIVLLANAAEKIVKAVKAAKAPNEKQDERLRIGEVAAGSGQETHTGP